jgi:hypothetical protein
MKNRWYILAESGNQNKRKKPYIVTLVAKPVYALSPLLSHMTA